MMKDFVSFQKSLEDTHPPEGISDLIQALWWDAKGDWDKAHNTAQDCSTAEGSWVHAYLHRKEGDQGNARYWYSRAGRPFSQLSLEDEWEEIVQELLERWVEEDV